MAKNKVTQSLSSPGVWGMLVLFCWSVLSAPVIAGRNKYALLIAIGDYQQAGLVNLPGVYNDIQSLKSVLQDKLGIAEQNIVRLVDAQASHLRIQQAFLALSRRIKSNDLAYIHYSGHGSRTKDGNDDERGGYDETWVPWGARTGKSDNLDDYDILDDEIFTWLQGITAKTENLIFVSDSCHSATVTRSVNRYRSVSADQRKHPLANIPHNIPRRLPGIYIGAARDDENAGEFLAPNGKAYGLFSWYWQKALQVARNSERWQDIFQQVSVQVNRKRWGQHPQLYGNRRSMTLSGESADGIDARMSVIHVSGQGALLEIDAGEASGMSKGALLVKASNPADVVEITRVHAFRSLARIKSGQFKTGDLLLLSQTAWQESPIPVFVKNKADTDYLQKKVHALLENMPGFALDSEKAARLIIFLTIVDEEIIVRLEDGSGQDLWGKEDEIVFPLWKSVRLELQKKLQGFREYARWLDLRSTWTPELQWFCQLWLWSEIASCHGSGCVKINDRYYQKKSLYSAEMMQGMEVKTGSLLSFELKGNLAGKYFMYLLNLDHGSIQSIYPNLENFAQTENIGSGYIKKNLLEGVGLLLDRPGRETVKLLLSKQPLNSALFNKQFRKKRLDKSVLMRGTQPQEADTNWSVALNKLLLQDSRSASLRSRLWGVLQFSIWVQ